MAIPRKEEDYAKERGTAGMDLGSRAGRSIQVFKRASDYSPVLELPDFNKPFEVHTDVSLMSHGAILY